MNSSKISYCSLKDAFKTPNFTKNEEEITLRDKELHTLSYTIKDEDENEDKGKNENIVGKFDGGCDYIREHVKNCKHCGCVVSKPLMDIALNDILNVILIFLMLWIIIYKPKL